MSELDFGGDDGIVTDDKNNGSSSSSGSVSIPEPNAEAVSFILDVLEAKGAFEVPAFADDAPELKEDYQEHYGLDDVNTLSVEELFGQDWSDYDYVGTMPLASKDSLTDEQKEALTDDEQYTKSGKPKEYVPDPEYVEELRDAEIGEGLLTPISKGINAYHSADIAERFGEDTRIKVAIGKKRNNDGDALKQRKSVHFSVSDSKNAAYHRRKWEAQVSEDFDQEDFEEWAAENGFEDKLED